MRIALTLFFTLLFTACTKNSSTPSSSPDMTEIRIGWQIPWATQGQLVQIMKHTDVLKENNLKAEFIGRTYGPMLNELALADSIDVVLTADQPAAVLFSKEKGWKAIGRLMYNRTSTYVPINSPIKTLMDLKGKKIGVPIGAAAERVTVNALTDAGLKKTDFEMSNLGIREHMPLIAKHKDDPKWGDYDALSGFDPVPAILEAKNLVRPIHVGKVVSVVLMNEKFITQNPEAPIHFMKALKQSYKYFGEHKEQANDWFMKEAKLPESSQKACEIAASLEPNLVMAKAPMRMGFNADDFKVLQKAADFVAPKIKKTVDMTKYVSNKYVEGL
ncbi:MAG: ABC transporter substrate-binding protein [Bdellovibrionales bacterium]|nr:ABC transporter substrate-binding protein [Bdellovibrionales bacterium]NQZ17769.1 ABC transporter substrate-binding protein [Bdellovibrionales bacterium]